MHAILSWSPSGPVSVIKENVGLFLENRRVPGSGPASPGPRLVPVDAAACRAYRDPGARNHSQVLSPKISVRFVPEEDRSVLSNIMLSASMQRAMTRTVQEHTT